MKSNNNTVGKYEIVMLSEIKKNDFSPFSWAFVRKKNRISAFSDDLPHNLFLTYMYIY